MKKSNIIKELLLKGKTHKEIQEKSGATKATVSYHASKLKLNPGQNFAKADWDKVQIDLNNGKYKIDVLKDYCLGSTTFYKAVANGTLTYTMSSEKYDLERVMVVNSTYNRGNLKKRLLDLGILKNVCVSCGQLPEWQGKRLVLVLDHINGVHNDNRIENLRMLCPNCNSQTDTFAGKNAKYKIKLLPDGVIGNTPFSESG